MKIIIRDVTTNDAETICDIYNPYVATTAISFEQQPVSAHDMRERITSVTAKYPWLVAESQEGVIAYAYATRWRTRAAYDQTAESAIYVQQTAQRTGAGYLLYMEL